MHFVLREEDCPGLIAFLDSLENRMESKTVRAILSNWFDERKADGATNLVDEAARTIHNFELGILHSKVHPRLADRAGVAVSSERKPVLAPATLRDPSPPPGSGLLAGSEIASAGSMVGDSLKSRQWVPEVAEGAPENHAPVENKAVVGLVDDMFGL